MWMLQVCPLSASNSYPSHDIALYKATDGKVADDKTRETLLKAVKARDAEAIAKAVKEVNESKTVKAKAEHIVDRSIVALATFARLNSRLVSLAAFSPSSSFGPSRSYILTIENGDGRWELHGN